MKVADVALNLATAYNPYMKLSADQVKHVAKLASLPITDKEVEKFAEQLSETLDYVEKLDEVATEGVEPTSQVTGLVNVTREDIVAPSLSQEEALKNVKSQYNGFVKVKAILDQEANEY